VLATIGFALLAPGSARTAAAPVAVLASLAGLPHGAADAGLLRSAPVGRTGLLGLGYLLAALLTGVLIMFAPVPTFVALLVLAVVHFGTGELEYARPAAPVGGAGQRSDGAARWPRARDAAAVLAVGGVAVAVPFAVHPRGVDAVLRAVSPGLPGALPMWWRWAAVALAAVCAVAVAAVDLPRGRVGPVAELALLALLGLSAPPVLAFGIFFGAWHSLRHTARLLALPAAPLPAASGSVSSGPVAAGYTGPTLDRRTFACAGGGSVLVAAAAITVLWGTGTAAPGLVAAAVSALLALTVPHTAVVLWLDRRSRPVRPS